ncbi:MAG: hypothetical protein H7288_11635 [Kineosporiaceae bacterium]|nr:hypothetical protein [Aeromicrobium sp.]
MTTETEFAVFLVTRNWNKVRKERFIESPRVTIARNYANETEEKLLLIRAQARNERRN